MDLPINQTLITKWMVRMGWMHEEDALKEVITLQAGQAFTLFLVCFGCTMDFLILGDSEVSGKISRIFSICLRYVFLPIMFYNTLANFFLVGSVDPGYVGKKRVRAKKEGAHDDDLESGKSSLLDKASRGDWLKEGRDAPVVEGRRLDLDLNSDYYDYCERCEVNLPMDRSIGHCHICDACIEGLDHHCPWVGQCIGKKNEKYFMRFNVSWVILLTQLIVTVLNE